MESELKILSLLLGVLLMVLTLSAQPPALIPYQAIARDAAGNAVLNQNISLRFSIHDQTITGTVVWYEAQTVLSSPLGVVVTSLGSVSDLSSVNWANGDKFLQVEMDITGGTNYSDMGTQQMMSVPYALYAGQAGQAAQVGGSSLSLGDSHEGGVVVYLDQTGQHGFVMADSVFSAAGMPLGYGPAGCYPGIITSPATGDGDINTLTLAGQQYAVANSVIYFVSNSNFNGYDDWFIPSTNEIRRIFFNVFQNGIGNLPSGGYISSTLYRNTGNNIACQQSFYAEGIVFDPNIDTLNWGINSITYGTTAPNVDGYNFLMLRKF
jgi:hypothetical protein